MATLGMPMFDTEKLTVKCPGCGHEITETIGRLKNSPTIFCNGCQKPVRVDARELAAGLRSVDKAFGDLEKAF